MARVGIRDVAVHADVAVGTVSHFLNHPDRVAPERAARIRAAIETLGYVPSHAARQLRTAESNLLGYIAPDVSNPHFAEIAEGVESRAEELGMTVFLANSHRNRAREDTYLQVFEEHRPRGLIVSSHLPIEDRLAALRVRGTPSVLVGQYAHRTDQPSVSLDDVDGGRQAAEHLLELGRTRIAFIGGPLHIPQVADRLAGASAALRRHGGATLEVIATTERTIAAGREAGLQILERDPAQRPDAIFAVNDLLALGALQMLNTRGVSIPGDLAIIGYDDTEYAEASLIPLSSIQARNAGIGRIVVDLLMEVVQGREHDLQLVMPPKLVPRASTVGSAVAS